MLTLSEKKTLLSSITAIAAQASHQIMEIYKGDIEVDFKDDLSPLTQADTRAHTLIVEALEKLTPALPIISEEGTITTVDQKSFWFVDPLDGTKEFIHRNGEFTVNIAYIENSQPILGIVCAPALQVAYTGIVGDQAYKISENNQATPIHVQADFKDDDEITILGSRSHGNSSDMDKFLSNFTNARLQTAGSSLKFCRVAEGSAHMYPRFGRTMEWDTAAGQAVLMAAGGDVISLENKKTLTYGKKDFGNPHFIAYCTRKLLEP